MTKATWIAAGILVAAATQVAAAPVYLGSVGPKKEVKGDTGSKAEGKSEAQIAAEEEARIKAEEAKIAAADDGDEPETDEEPAQQQR